MEKRHGMTLGMNRTGAGLSPLHAPEMIEDTLRLTNPSPGSAEAIAENRVRYIREADPIGSIPPPSTLKGAVETLRQRIMQGSHALIDKLGERLAFERAGTRLYDALISKHVGSAFPEKLPSLEILHRFRDEEAQHFRLVAKTLRDMGGDPTAITPAANIVGTASMGWVQVMTDPRTTFAQCLEVILMAELVDHDGWDILIQLAEAGNLSEVAEQFREALTTETEHLVSVRAWVKQMNLPSGAGYTSEAAAS